MPIYGFVCAECDAEFEERRPFSESNAPACCPFCDSHKTKRTLNIPMVFSNNKTPGQVGTVRLSAGGPGGSAHGAGCPCCRPRISARGTK